ncbi:unnamed protein product (macronuclear) [Paramecium tetraurelia]|uniref:Transmembrane protein n=1 Tax=Paramecium tetraurelia TaxID=5888 RepID=A0CR31_PARTE|nr:uncharacterized protein GSPATT00009561001 [Paramecium tetraurelia]CAK73248.1 unnamed protein product [Paramecium tetraurelia]|eukprot:XP_001440645.1 hypothetical protein (macronuclear) [Paramecium tetraurelia strain d4-2]
MEKSVNVQIQLNLGVFNLRCQNASIIQLSNLGCSDKFSKHACMNVRNHRCQWDLSCQYVSNEQIEFMSCDQQYKMPVSPLVCSSIPKLECMNSGPLGDYKCVSIYEKDYSQLKCTELGLTELACRKIVAFEEKCIFQNNVCRKIQDNEIVNCNQKINKLACLSIDNPNLSCYWMNLQCLEFKLSDENQEIPSNISVSSNVCSMLKDPYKFDAKKYQCVPIPSENFQILDCNTIGLSKKGCLLVKNKNCCFYGGKCQELNEQDLKNYLCEMDLNEQACVNLETEFQYCQWNGNNCERIFMNQDIDCPLKFNNDLMKVNGNVCQAISKSNVLCKYDKNTNLCVASTNYDECETPFLNFLGCISIQKHHQTCQWYQNKCRIITIQQNSTLCETLKFVNAQSCSQVYESNSIGCYYDQNSYQCKSVSIDSNQQILNKIQELYTISCKDLSLGINKVLCASLTTPSTPCRWYQEQCTFAKQQSLKNILCQNHINANYQACAQIEFNKTKCSYSYYDKQCFTLKPGDIKGCNNNGLNKYACSSIDEFCYYKDFTCKYAQGNLNNIFCQSSYPTKKACLAITTEGQFCQWSDKINECIDFVIEENHQCEIQNVNHLVCAKVINYAQQQVEDKDFKGYCKYNENKNSCEALGEYQCTTNCCTEAVGINAHACIKLSNKSYICYFYNLRCQELTKDVVDINDLKQVKLYFNALKLPCSSIMKKYCHMIDWSETQRCFSYGEICIHFNTNYYPNIKKLIIQKQPVFNKFACLSVEGGSEKKDEKDENDEFKYLTYNEEKKICQPTRAKYQRCEEVNGNRNVCMSHTENLYCRWNASKLKCVTITEEELDQINSCELDQNKNACFKNKHKICSFDINTDKCLNFKPDEKNDEQKNVQSVCVQLEGKPYQFSQSNECSDKDIQKFSGCVETNINSLACYKYSQGYCRWNSEFFSCYENEDDFDTLGCSDNLNWALCLEVTKEKCIWNEAISQCQSFEKMTNNDCENKLNENACLSMNECGYNQKDKTCQKLEQNMNCSDIKMNKSGCLLNTRGHKCHYTDGNCQQFQSDQTICDSQIDINIEVCMDIPKPCYFNIESLKCENVEIEIKTTCESLFDSFPQYKNNNIADQESKEGRYYNKMACSSISMDLELGYGKEQCVEDSTEKQQCNYQKYCFWNSAVYTCNVYELLKSEYDKQYHIGTTEYLWESKYNNGSNSTLEDFEKLEIDKECSQQIYLDGNYTQQINISICENVKKKCQDNSDCVSLITYQKPTSIEEAQYQKKKSDQNTNANSNCQKYCQPVQSCSNSTLETSLKFTNNLEKVCKFFTFYVSHPLCSNFKNIYKITECDNIYSKALCLQYIEADCYFDINQGGCRQLTGNEHKLPGCSAISKKCDTSYSKNAICKVKEISQNCQSIEIETTQCQKIVNLKQITFGQKCSEILPGQPILCAKAKDVCRFDGTKCYSNTNQDPCKCDKSYSKELCEYCNCDYMFLGYCQEKVKENDKEKNLSPQLNEDCSNQYSLCYEVTEFVEYNKKKVCGYVDQACKFKDNKCEDATHSTCTELIDLIVSQQACIRCKDQPMKYSTTKQKCEPIYQTINQCENLNKEACLSQSKGIKCKWKWNKTSKCKGKKFEFECQNIEDKDLDLLDCAILNEDACKEKQYNLCWFNQETKLCMKYNPFKGECQSFKNKQTCIQSMVESCIWTNDTCQIASEQQQCDGLNKFGCLNCQSKPCVWSDKSNKCELAIIIDPSQNCTDLQQSDISHVNALTCRSMKTKKPCILSKNYKCREIIEPILYQCETVGLNKYACILNTKNKCAFLNKECITIHTQKEGCKDYLNQNACLNQEEQCRFEHICMEFKYKNYDQLYQSGVKNYSRNICKQFDKDLSFNKSLIYSDIEGRFIEIPQSNAFISKCGTNGINKQACLSNTQDLCQYVDFECKIFRNQNQQECLSSLNWVACINLDQKCKFVQFKCQPLSEESCESLKIEKAIINYKVCANTIDKPCKYDSNTLSCTDEIDQDEPCSALGLNQKGCVFKTKSSKCKFQDNECKSDYETAQTALCTDKINERKCLSIQNQNCKFFQEDGCQNICQIGTCLEQPCYYDEEGKICKQLQLNDDHFNGPNLHLLNQQACLIIENSNTFWDDQCILATEEMLKTLECHKKLNKLACRNVKTKSQYCQFLDGRCKAYDTESNQKCENIRHINNGIICSLIKNQDCKYDSSQSNCVIVEQEESKKLNCEEKAQQFYSQKACEQDKNCRFIEKCIQKKEVQDQNKEQCTRVTNMPSFWNGGECKQKEKKLSDSCQDISAMSGNLNACIQVEKFGEMCVFKDDKCQAFHENEGNHTNCPNNINKNACLQQTKFECFWKSVQDNVLEHCEIFVKQNESDCENNLSLKACLRITTEGTYCQWKHGECQKVQVNELDTELLLKRYVNSNTCRLLKNVAVIYDQNLYYCVQIKKTDYLSCSPPNPGMNYLACLSVKRKDQFCTWNYEKKVCQNNQEANLENYERNCQIQGTNPINCSQREVKGPCGGIEEGCDQVDLNKVKCNHIGLNQEACVNLKSQPCTWVKGMNDDFDHCEETIPGKCEGNDLIVNALVCSMVVEYEACFYDSENHTCKRLDNDITDCNVQGINSYGCMQIKNCYFENYTCKLFDQNSNMSCRDANFANESVCSQIKVGTCKYNQLGFGCIESSFDDFCSTPGINMNGCNQMDQCQWKDEICQCKKLIMQQKDCLDNQDQENCNYSSKCSFDISISEDSKRVCKKINDGFQNVCNQLESGKACYQNIAGECNEADSCNDIQNPQCDCSEYSFDNMACINGDNDRCAQFESCEKLNQIECGKYTSNCVLLLSCVTKQCHHNKDKQSCINFNCTWIDYYCREQISCSEIKTEYYCNINYQNGMQCSWHSITENHITNQFCTFEGCNSLQKNVFCHGVQVLQSVCLQVHSNLCLTCQQILDACECMNYADYCEYDVKKQLCKSLSCESYNQLSCPKTRCQFNQQIKICIPQCQFNYNKKQCQQFDICTWDDLFTPPCYKVEIIEEIPQSVFLTNSQKIYSLLIFIAMLL